MTAMEPQHLTFFDLPPEIRLRVYEYSIGFGTITLGEGTSLNLPSSPAITQTTRHIRCESLPVFYRTTLFRLVIHHRNDNLGPLCPAKLLWAKRWPAMMDHASMAHLRRLSVMQIISSPSVHRFNLIYLNFDANKTTFKIDFLSHYLLTVETSTYLRAMFMEDVVTMAPETRDGALMLRIINNIMEQTEAAMTSSKTYERYLVTFEVSGPERQWETLVKAHHVRGKEAVDVRERYDRFGRKIL